MTTTQTSNTTNSSDLPLLRRGVAVSMQNNGVALRHLRDEVLLEGPAAQLFGRMQAKLDGKTPVRAIAEKLSEKPARLQALAEELEKAGVLSFLSSKDGERLITGEEFYKIHHEYCDSWLSDVYQHPLWEKMITGKATRAQVIGFAFEKYHYI